MKQLITAYIFLILTNTMQIVADLHEPVNSLPADIQTKATDINNILQPFTATYQVNHKSSSVGKATRTLSVLDDGQLEFRYQTNSRWFFITDKRKEVSVLKLTDQQLTPLSYSYERTGTGSDKSYRWTFNKKDGTVTNLKNNQTIETDFKDNFQDKLSFQLQFRLDVKNNPEQTKFKYSIIGTDGKKSEYIYYFQGIEELKLATGTVQALKYRRDSTNGKRTIFAWFAPEHDYLLVKLKQLKHGKPSFDVQLLSTSLTSS